MCHLYKTPIFIAHPHISLVGILVSRCMMVNYQTSQNHCFPEDKYDTLEYSWVKATAASVHLRISLFALTNAHKLSGAVAGEAIGVKILIFTLISASLVYH